MPGTLVAEHLNRPLFDTGTATAVAFPKSATVEKVEEATLGFLKENNLLILDMSDVTFIDVAGLTAIIALLAGRQSQARATKLRLPLSEKVRHFFRRWAFPQAIRAVTGIRFFDIVIAEDHKYFQGVGGDRGEGYAGPTARYEMRGGDIFVPLEVKRFFGYQYWDPVAYFSTRDVSRIRRPVIDECLRWDGELIKTVLRRHLGPNAKYISSHIVHEAMSNAFRHPNAKSILLVSQVQHVGLRDAFLTIVVWDDGISMYDTLRRPLSSGVPITRESGSELVAASYSVKYKPQNGRRSRRLNVTSREKPDADSPDYKLLLATIFPGITSDPEGREHDTHPAMREGRPEALLPGMGLYNLINGAVDVMGGSVAFRTGSFFMNVAPGEAKGVDAQYAVKLEEKASFFGNTVTVRIPLRPPS